MIVNLPGTDKCQHPVLFRGDSAQPKGRGSAAPGRLGDPLSECVLKWLQGLRWQKRDIGGR